MQLETGASPGPSPIDGQKEPSSTVFGKVEVRELGASLLFKALPGPACHERWIKAFESADAAAQERLWSDWIPQPYDDWDRARTRSSRLVELDRFWHGLKSG